MKIRLKLLLFIFFFVLLYAVYYWGIPAIFDIEHKASAIQNIVKKELGAEIELKNPKLKMGLSPSIWLDADYFSVKDKPSTPLLIVNPKLKIRLIPLLFGKINLAYLSCDKIKADFKVDKNYRFYIGKYIIIENSNSKISVENSKMNVGDYEINIKDELQNKNILLKGDYFNLDKYNPKKQIKFSTNSRLKVNERYSDINVDVDLKLPLNRSFYTDEIVFDGTITNLNLEDFSPYIRKLSNNKIRQTSGILNIQADTQSLNMRTSRITTQMIIENLSILSSDKQTSVHFKDKLNISTMVDVSKNILKIKKLKILSGSINTSIAGSIKNLNSKKPTLNLTLVVNKSRIEDFISLLPAVNLKNIDLNLVALKKYGYYSDLKGKLLIRGKSDKPNITGEFLSENAYVIKPLNIPKATVKLKFLGKKMYIDVFVPITNTENATIKGDLDLYGEKNVDLKVTSTPNIDLQTVTFILNPVHEILYFDIGPIPVMKLSGVGNIHLKIAGNKTNSHLFGDLNFKNTTASFNGLDAALENLDGSLYFQDKDTHFITQKAILDGKPIKIDGKCSLLGVLDYDITATEQNLAFLLDILKNSPVFVNIQKTIPTIKNAGGKLNIALKLKGKVNNISDFTLGKTVFASGNIKLLGNDILLSDLQIPIKNLFGNIKFNNTDADFDLYSAVEKSKLRFKGKIRNNTLYSKIKLDDLAFLYSNIPVKIFSGNLELNNDKLTLYRVNATLDSMPIFVDGFVTDIFKNPKFNLYTNSKPTQKFIDKYINKDAIYPLKTKGDIIYSGRINGTKDSFNAQAEINLQEDSSIYYMGSTLGDTNDPIRIFLDANVSKKLAKNSIYVNNFQYDKLISSQNNKEFVSPQLSARGQIDVNKNEITLHDFIVKTQNPTDAKIFNILFKKPMIKQGLFSSNVLINGPITSPKLVGFLNFTGINIPLLDTTIKDISLDFSPDKIDIKSKGEIFSNKIIFFSNMKNCLTPPYILSDVDIYLGNLDVNQIAKRLNKLEFETDMHKLTEQKQDVNITNLVVKNAKLKADSVLVKNIFAKDLTADFSLNENLLFSLDDFKFDVAQGSVNGDFEYNILNSKSKLSLNVDKVNANSMAEALFDLPNQIYGSLTGQADLTCNGKTHKTCMDTLNGSGGFRVANGRMPKLGSLEYLLKSVNLVKSGVTGLTINGIIELVTPLKTGEFENINGNFSISSGIADSIQIFSKGKDLSLFLTGKYNFSTLIADMKVFGRISKKISNVLGPVGNTSLNTLFNTIPGVNLDDVSNGEIVKNLNKIPGFELNDKAYRIFSAEIYGDINTDNYVQSFKWLE